MQAIHRQIDLLKSRIEKQQFVLNEKQGEVHRLASVDISLYNQTEVDEAKAEARVVQDRIDYLKYQMDELKKKLPSEEELAALRKRATRLAKVCKEKEEAIREAWGRLRVALQGSFTIANELVRLQKEFEAARFSITDIKKIVSAVQIPLTLTLEKQEKTYLIASYLQQATMNEIDPTLERDLGAHSD